jgi:hypothetical protein
MPAEWPVTAAVEIGRVAALATTLPALGRIKTQAHRRGDGIALHGIGLAPGQGQGLDVRPEMCSDALTQTVQGRQRQLRLHGQTHMQHL